MIVIKHIIDIDKKERVKYPTIFGNEVVGLDKNISFYEIVENDKPTYNPNQFTVEESIELTDIVGENKLKLAQITYSTVEKSEAQIINFLNTELGNHLDTEYPTWARVKDHVRANGLRWDVGIDNFTPEQQIEYNYIISLDTWANKCRDDRDNYEQDYKATGILANIIFDSKPPKDE